MPTSVQCLEMLARYKAWADEKLYVMLAGVSVTELAAPTPIFAGSILRTLNHVYLMDLAWKSHLLGIPHHLTSRNPEATPSFVELHEVQRDIDDWYIDYAAAMTPEVCNDVVQFTFIGGGGGALRREDIVLHAINHTTYHRGHVTAMLNQLGKQVQATDLPVFLRGQAARSANDPHRASQP